MGQPYGILDSMSVREVSWMIEGYFEAQKDHYEMINNAVKIAGASILSGKDMKLFDSVELEEEKMTYEEREEELDYLAKQFGEF